MYLRRPGIWDRHDDAHRAILTVYGRHVSRGNHIKIPTRTVSCLKKLRTRSSRNENPTSSEDTTTTSAGATPIRDAFFDHLNSVKDRCSAIGYTFVEGIERDDEEDDDDDDEGGDDKEKTDNKA